MYTAIQVGFPGFPSRCIGPSRLWFGDSPVIELGLTISERRNSRDRWSPPNPCSKLKIPQFALSKRYLDGPIFLYWIYDQIEPVSLQMKVRWKFSTEFTTKLNQFPCKMEVRWKCSTEFTTKLNRFPCKMEVRWKFSTQIEPVSLRNWSPWEFSTDFATNLNQFPAIMKSR